jgi:hypothetical protein
MLLALEFSVFSTLALPATRTNLSFIGDLKTSITVRNNQKDLMLCCVTCVHYDISCDNLLTIILREPFFGRSWSFFAILIYKTWGQAEDSNSTQSLGFILVHSLGLCILLMLFCFADYRKPSSCEGREEQACPSI